MIDKLIDSCIEYFLNKSLTKKPVTLTADKKDLVKNCIRKSLTFCKIRGIFKSSTRVSNFSQFKDKMPCCLRSSVVCRFSCATYYGKTCRNLSVIVGEHSSVSSLPEKKSKSKKATAVKHHLLFCDHILSIEYFEKMASSNSDFHVKVKESLLISCDEPILNKNQASLPL